MLCIRKEEIKEVKSFFRKSGRRVSRYKYATHHKSATHHKYATVYKYATVLCVHDVVNLYMCLKNILWYNIIL